MVGDHVFGPAGQVDLGLHPVGQGELFQEGRDDPPPLRTPTAAGARRR